MKKPKLLPPVRPNVGIKVAYRRQLQRLVDEMARSYDRWIAATWRADPPKMALDATPAEILAKELERLGRQWRKRFDEGAEEMARHFAKRTWRRSDDALRGILRRANFSVKFEMTPAMRDVFEATVQENVSLIRSIPEQYHTQVEGAVMRSVAAGRDLASLARELEERYHVARDRAVLIARDQNNKATASLQRARQTDLGLKQGIWLHSHGGKVPRKTHLANHGKTFSIAEGWFDPDPKVRRRIMPGELINCRCVWRPVVPGLT